jgi:CHASE3 domain sensor protein
MKNLDTLKKNALVYAAIVVLIFITINTIIIYYNNSALKETTRLKTETERALLLTDLIWNQVVRNVDVAMRGYALTKAENMLLPMKDGQRDKVTIFAELRQITSKQGFTHPQAIDSIYTTVDAFINDCLEMAELAKKDSMTEFRAKLAADPGRAAWFSYEKNARTITSFERTLNEEAMSSYENANRRIIIAQTVLLIIAFPTLLFIIFKITKDKKERRDLFLKLESNNHQYLFNPGATVHQINENEVIDSSIRNFKNATHFISQVSNGDFNVQWEGMNEENEALNKDNLAGELIRMRDKMKSIKAQDDIRNWTSEGLARFNEVIRKNQDHIEALCFDILVYITKYLNAQQGGLFVLQEDEEGREHLKLAACYAFNRKKFIEKKVGIGEGLVGQVYLEGQSVMLTQIPHGYTSITSGLGESTPSCLLIIPMKYNDKVEAVIEIAGFRKFAQHEIEFAERIGEITASTLGSVKNTEKMKHLVDQFRSQTEQLRAQEEELRQNMEEMEATQEAMKRQEREDYA